LLLHITCSLWWCVWRMADDSAGRKDISRSLTSIPEQERPVQHRFTVVLVGDFAQRFAEQAGESDMAEAFRPARRSTHSDGGIDLIAGAEKEVVVFCPVDGGKALARLRLHPCSSFSESLPLTKDPVAAKAILVALLFWRRETSSEEEVAAAVTSSLPEDAEQPVTLDDGMPTQATTSLQQDDAEQPAVTLEEAIQDWRSRLAEINFLPEARRPLTRILAFGVDRQQEESLGDFVASQKCVESREILPESPNPDLIMEALQDFAEAGILRSKISAWSSGGASGMFGSKIFSESRSKCCNVL